MSKFVWGKIIDRFEYDFDGSKMCVIKYNPWEVDGCTVRRGAVDYSETLYSCEELHQSDTSLFVLIIAWIADKKLGLNEGPLVRGIAKSLDLYDMASK